MTSTHIHATGFTIIELMITVAIASILLTIGVPAFNNMIRTNRIATQTNMLVGALNYARGETATRGVPVAICAYNTTRTACDNSATNWANGWMIFTDRGVAGTVDGADEVLQTGLGPVGGFTLTTTGGFARFGVGASASTALTFAVTPTDSSVCVTTGTRQIVIGPTGRIATSKSTC